MARSRSDTGLSTLPGAVAAPGHGTGRSPSRLPAGPAPPLRLVHPRTGAAAGRLPVLQQVLRLPPHPRNAAVRRRDRARNRDRRGPPGPLALAPPAGNRSGAQGAGRVHGGLHRPAGPRPARVPARRHPRLRRSGTTASSPSWSPPPRYASRPSSRAYSAGTGRSFPGISCGHRSPSPSPTWMASPRSASPAPTRRSTPSGSTTSPFTWGSDSGSSGSASTGWSTRGNRGPATYGCRSWGCSRCWWRPRRAAAASSRQGARSSLCSPTCRQAGGGGWSSRSPAGCCWCSPSSGRSTCGCRESAATCRWSRSRPIWSASRGARRAMSCRARCSGAKGSGSRSSTTCSAPRRG